MRTADSWVLDSECNSWLQPICLTWSNWVFVCCRLHCANLRSQRNYREHWARHTIWSVFFFMKYRIKSDSFLIYYYYYRNMFWLELANVADLHHKTAHAKYHSDDVHVLLKLIVADGHSVRWLETFDLIRTTRIIRIYWVIWHFSARKQFNNYLTHLVKFMTTFTIKYMKPMNIHISRRVL